VPVLLASISGTLTSFVGDHGLYAVFVLMAIDAVFPAASELVMVTAGALAAGAFAGHAISFTGHGLDAYVAVSISGTLGYLVGSWIGWWIGLHGGRPLVERHGRWLHLNVEKLDRAERWFSRWEDWGVFVGRLTPVVRSFVSIPAGVFRMPIGPYAVLTLIGSAIWAFGLAGAGYALGSSYERFHEDFRWVEYAVVAGVLAVAAYLIYAARVRHRRAEDPAR